jgi:FkbM family methyltransferase
MKPSAAFAKFAAWSRNLGIAQATRYTLYRILNPAFDRRILTLYVKGLRQPLFCRAGGSDLRVFAQVLANREYRCLDRSDISGLIIDCGANIGLSTVYFLTRFPNTHLIALEPDPDNFKMLALNTASFSDRVTLLQAAVWNRNTGLVFSDSRFRDGNEWTRSCRESEASEIPQIEAFDISTILAMSSFERVGLLKVDIERGELVLFDESAENWIKLVDTIAIELHGPDCENAFHTIVAKEDFLVSHCEELTVCSRKMPSSS